MKKTRQVDETYYVCDNCGKEYVSKSSIYRCIICRKEVCSACKTIYELKLTETVGVGSWQEWIVGLTGAWCTEHRDKMKQVLYSLGFKEFSYKSKGPRMMPC